MNSVRLGLLGALPTMIMMFGSLASAAAQPIQCSRVVFEGKGVLQNGKVLLRVSEGSDNESDYELEPYQKARHQSWIGVNIEMELVYREPCLLGCKVERFKLLRLLEPYSRPKARVDALGSLLPVACPSRK